MNNEEARAAQWQRPEIEMCLPHRDDALFVTQAWLSSGTAGIADGNAAMGEDDGAAFSGGGVARWHAEHAVLRGHFPGLPIVPGVFLIEAAAQIAGVLMMQAASRMHHQNTGDAAAARTHVGLLSGVRKVLVHQPVRPAQDVRYCMSLTRAGAGRYVAQGDGRVDTRKAVSFELFINVVERAQVFGQLSGQVSSQMQSHTTKQFAAGAAAMGVAA